MTNYALCKVRLGVQCIPNTKCVTIREMSTTLQAGPSHAQTRKEGVLLYSLEVELPTDPQLAELAIFVQGLFSPQVVLTDSQLVSSANTQRFFLANSGALSDMMSDLQSYELPLIGTMGRGGADCEKSLDILLKPREGKPPRLATLSSAQYEKLQVDYDRMSEEARRERFYSVTGTVVREYFKTSSAYFQKLPERTVVGPPLRNPEEGLYTEVRKYVDTLTRDIPETLSDTDKSVCDALLQEIETRSPAAPRTRERLHRAIYGEHFPPYHDGRVVWSHVGVPPNRSKDEWRFLINALYNVNLAESFGLRHGINSPWYNLKPGHLSKSSVQREQIGILKLASTIYPAFIDFPFVRNVRKEPQFWKNMANPQLNLSDHLEFIAERFAKHLTDKGQGHLVRKYEREVIVNVIKRATIPSSLATVILALFYGQSFNSAVTVGLETAGRMHVLAWGVESLFETLPDLLGDQWNLTPGFKNFVGDLGSVVG